MNGATLMNQGSAEGETQPRTCPSCGARDVAGNFCPQCGMALPPLTPGLPSAPSRTRQRRRRRLLKIAIGIFVVLMAACVALVIVAAIPDPAALGLSVLAAVVPALIYSKIILSLDRYEREPRRAILAAFGWGAVGAIFFSIIAELIFGAIVISATGEEAGSFLSTAVGAPIIEETFKGVALLAILLFFRHEFDNVLDGLVYGALIGLGFALTENVLYFGTEYVDNGMDGLGQLFVVRAVIDGFGHAAYTATTGAALGWSRTRYSRGIGRVIVPIIGYSLAILQHFLWNAGIYVIAGAQGEDATIWSVVLVEAPLIVLPALIVLYVIARTAGLRELAILREQLAPEVARGVLTPAEYETVTDNLRRRQALQEAARRGGKPLRAHQRRFFQVAAELAFRQYHLSRGDLPKPGQRAPEESYREELASLRSVLVQSL